MEHQKTINKEFTLEGKGLHTGKPVKVFFYPARENAGIKFIRSDLEGTPALRPADLASFESDRRTIASFGKARFETLEHVLAALWGAEINNIRIELNFSEPPALDGSAKPFLEALEKAGIDEQKAERQFIEIKEPLWVEEKNSFLGVFPADAFKISYILEYPGYFTGRQFYSEVLTPDVFRKNIASARTIWLVPSGPGSLEQKAKFAKVLGYGRGADSENVLIIAKDGIINEPRFPDEFAKHKVLDLIGDLYLLGKPVKGRVIAIRSGHKLNLELVRLLRASLRAPRSGAKQSQKTRSQ